MAFFSSTLLGVQPLLVEIEIHLSEGLPFFQIVGLPDTILRESKTRVKSAILQAGFDFPYEDRVVLNLAPSKIKKEGSGFELGLAARILASSNQIADTDKNVLFLGELALDGTIRTVPEIEALSFAAHSHFAKGQKIDLIVVNNQNIDQVAHLGLPVLGVKHISELAGVLWWEKGEVRQKTSFPTNFSRDLSKLKFAPFWAKHLLIAAVGGHNYFLCGPPGCGKTFFAESLRILLSLLKREPDVERQLLNSIFGRESSEFPWAAPHHSATVAGLLGGGSPPRPGALTRAHGGVLFLDELLEFSPASLDSLREPIEKGVVEIFRAGTYLSFPSSFQIVGATNPCRCGNWKNTFKRCLCMPTHRKLYQSRMSGPFFDRFDVRLVCSNVTGTAHRISGDQIVSQAQALIQKQKTDGDPLWTDLSTRALEQLATQNHLSFRAQEKIKRVATTLAHIDGKNKVDALHIREAADLQTFKGLESVV